MLEKHVLRVVPERNSVWHRLNEALFGGIHRDTANESTQVKSQWPKIFIGPFPAFQDNEEAS
jgi:hypothetical protein